MKMYARTKIMVSLFLLLLVHVKTIKSQSFNLVGEAKSTGPDCYQITGDVQSIFGAVWYTKQLDLTQPFDIRVKLNFGKNFCWRQCCKNAAECADSSFVYPEEGGGADGIAFVLQPVSINQGAIGQGIGYEGISPSLGTEFDTYYNFNTDPIYDHIAVAVNGVITATCAPYGNFSEGSINCPDIQQGLNSRGGMNVTPLCVPAMGVNPSVNELQTGADFDARFTWDPATKLYEVWFNCSKKITLKEDIVQTIFKGKPNVYYGFTSATGSEYNKHTICVNNITLNEMLPMSACKGNSVQLDASGIIPNATGLTYSWSPSIGLSNPNIANPLASPVTTTTYTVLITEPCYKDTVTRKVTVTITPGPIPHVTTTPASCSANNGTATVNNITGGTTPYTYLWSPVGGTDAAALALGAGNYTITVTDKNGCKGDTVVTVPGTVDFTTSVASTPSNCGMADGTATVICTGGTPNYTYKWSDGQATQTAMKLLGGTYTVSITDASGCTNHEVVTVGTSGSVTAQAGPNRKICAGQSSPILLTASGGNKYVWNTGDTTAFISVLPSTTSTYSVIVSVANCSDTAFVAITVNALPTAAFMPSSSCLGAVTTLTDGSLSAHDDPVVHWNWIMPGGTPATSVSQNGSTTFNLPGTHIITLVVTSKQGCNDTISQQVLVYHPPVANFSKPVKGCSPVYANYTDLSTSADGAISGWQWSFAGGSPLTSTIQNPTTIQYSTPGTYAVSLIITSTYGCKDTIDQTMVDVFTWPKADFYATPATAPYTNPVFSFYNQWSNDVSKWLWDFGDHSPFDTIHAQPTHSYTSTSSQNDFYKYDVCLYVENLYGCRDTACREVKLMPEFVFYIPNTFTPNDDGKNELFYGKGRGIKKYDIMIFDRWGNKIWECHQEDKNTNWDDDHATPEQEGLSSACKWNGIVQGNMNDNSQQVAQQDVYVWKIHLTDIFDKDHTYIGNVNIIK
jgi:gliding motility-associated-like protein